ncbi:MAG: proline dehydrogenase family protein [Actinomycetia bacterium]|nr:proline dehydrogenase family protein [Actinomycetes bacterium]
MAMLNPADLLRAGLLHLSESERVRSTIVKAPISRDVVSRFVAGDDTEDAVHVASVLRQTGRLATIDYLGEYTTDPAQAEHTRDAYLDLLRRLGEENLSQHGQGEVSLKLSALGQSLAVDGDAIALENARQICALAEQVGTTVTLDMEDHTTTDRTLEAARALRQDFPWVGVVLQSQLRRTEADCRDFATEGSRVRLCKGAYQEPESVAYQDSSDVDLAYVRCLKILMAGPGYPMLATHDPRLVSIGYTLAEQQQRAPETFEFQMLFGIRPDEQKRIADRGNIMRVYVPYGDEWYGYLMRRMAERPANTAFFLRALATKG